MKRKIQRIVLSSLLCVAMGSTALFAAEVKGKHNGQVSCIDCHNTDTPAKAAKKDACLKCHPEPSLKEIPVRHEGRDITIMPHKGPHDGGKTLRCALCHKIHAPSKISCNDCHHFEVKVP